MSAEEKFKINFTVHIFYSPLRLDVRSPVEKERDTECLRSAVCSAGCYHASHEVVQTTARPRVLHRGHSWHCCLPEGSPRLGERESRGHKVGHRRMLFFRVANIRQQQLLKRKFGELSQRVSVNKKDIYKGTTSLRLLHLCRRKQCTVLISNISPYCFT